MKKLLFSFVYFTFLYFFLPSAKAQTYYISTIAGNGTAGYSGDSGAATSAELFFPEEVAVDASGNVYIADLRNNRIRKVTAATGIITTFAGTGTAGYSGDGGAATSAELSYPAGVAVDASRNVYIIDDNRIRKVTAATGIITTIAGNGTAGYSGDGGAATSAELYYSNGVAVDASGTIYIVDNNRIRKVTSSTGIITTIAGNGTAGYTGDKGPATAAELSYPGGVAVDALGNVYIADVANNRIRKITASTGIITTIAGNGALGYSGDGGAATSAELNLPSGVAVDASGNVYIADDSNNVIRKITAGTGIITTIAGYGSPGYAGDGGTATSAQLNDPQEVTVDTLGNVYIADLGNNRIRKLSLSAPTTGITSSSSTDGYNVYPNPFSNLTTLVFNSSNTKPVNLTITDSKGIVVYSSTAYTNSEIVIGSQLPSAGMYFVQVSSETGVKVVKLIKTE